MGLLSYHPVRCLIGSLKPFNPVATAIINSFIRNYLDFPRPFRGGGGGSLQLVLVVFVLFLLVFALGPEAAVLDAHLVPSVSDEVLVGGDQRAGGGV